MITRFKLDSSSFDFTYFFIAINEKYIKYARVNDVFFESSLNKKKSEVFEYFPSFWAVRNVFALKIVD